MPGTYKIITVVGTSSKGISEAVQAAIAEAAKTVKGLAWFEVKELRGNIQDGNVAEYQATVSIGFKVIHE
jgi:flavin-binding protein dodecin